MSQFWKHISSEDIVNDQRERYSNCPNPTCGEPRYAGIDHVCHIPCPQSLFSLFKVSPKAMEATPAVAFIRGASASVSDLTYIIDRLEDELRQEKRLTAHLAKQLQLSADDNKNLRVRYRAAMNEIFGYVNLSGFRINRPIIVPAQSAAIAQQKIQNS